MEMDPEEQQDPSQTSDTPEVPHEAEPESQATSTAAEHKRPSADEALAEMRRSLREEETQEKTGFAASLSRLRKRFFGRKRQEDTGEITETPSRLDDMVIPETPARQEPVAPGGEPETPTVESPGETPPAAQGESSFGAMVRKRLTGPLFQKEDIAPPNPEPAPIEHIIEEPEQEVGETAAAGQSILTSLRSEDEEGQEKLTALRQEALEDYVTAPERDETESQNSLAGRLQRSWRYMRPMERNLLIGALVIVALAAIAGSGFLVVQSIPEPTPTEVPTVSTVPFPISISLPGGWIFPLRTGAVVNGKWNPQDAEWLQGTEVCRWVSLPWTVQLEAVLRTLKANDEIKLSMSNYDSLGYKVKSIEEVPASEINKLAADTPCLLVILSKQDSTTRWVVTAKP